MGHFTLVVYDPPELPHRVVVDAPCKFLQRQIPCLAAVSSRTFLGKYGKLQYFTNLN